MPQIIVTADSPASQGEPAVMFAERVNVSDFESDHFLAQLIERLGWAVGDADAVEQHGLAAAPGVQPEDVAPEDIDPQECEPADERPRIGSAPASPVLLRST